MINKPVEHLMVIPDGNRRYAVEHGISPVEAYRAGIKKLADIATWGLDDGRFDEITLGWLTTDNFTSRVDQMKILAPLAMELVKKIFELKARVNPIGNIERFSQFYPKCEEELSEFSKIAEDYDGRQAVNVNLAYDPDAELQLAIQKCISDGIPPTFKNIATRGTRPAVTFFLRAGYPEGFNKISCYVPGIERARLFSTPQTVQEMTREDFLKIIDSYFNLQDSVEKKYG